MPCACKLDNEVVYGVNTFRGNYALDVALAEMIGSVVLSRVVPDPALSDEIIDTVSNDLVKRHAKSSRTA